MTGRTVNIDDLISSGLCDEELKTTPNYIVDDVVMRNVWGDFSKDKCVQKVLELEELSIEN